MLHEEGIKKRERQQACCRRERNWYKENHVRPICTMSPAIDTIDIDYLIPSTIYE